jgi:16S rRNA processing protein RimM
VPGAFGSSGAPVASAPSTVQTAPIAGRLVVALVRGFRGLNGQTRVELLTDRPEERFAPGSVLFPEGTTEGLTVGESSAVADGPGWWLRFRELPDRNAAERLRDVYLEIEPQPEVREPGRWLWHEIEGIAVRSTSGEELGTVTEIYRAGGAEVFVVRGPKGEFDVPAVRGIVVDLAPDRGEMIVDLESLALDARPVDDEDYVRPRDRRPKKQPKPPKAPREPRPVAVPPKPAAPNRNSVPKATARLGGRSGSTPAPGPGPGDAPEAPEAPNPPHPPNPPETPEG